MYHTLSSRYVRAYLANLFISAVMEQTIYAGLGIFSWGIGIETSYRRRLHGAENSMARVECLSDKKLANV